MHLGFLSLLYKRLWIGSLIVLVIAGAVALNMRASMLKGQLGTGCYYSSPCNGDDYDIGGYCYAAVGTSCTCQDGTPGSCGAGSCMCSSSSSSSSACLTCACCVSNPNMPQCTLCFSSSSSSFPSSFPYSSVSPLGSSSSPVSSTPPGPPFTPVSSSNPVSSNPVSSNPPASSSGPQSSAGPLSSSPPASSACPFCNTVSSQASQAQSSAGNNSSRNSSAPNSAGSSAVSCSSLGDVVCEDVPPSCDYPSGEIPGCDQSCFTEYQQCYRDALAQMSSIRMPNMACPPPGPLEECNRARQRCQCGCVVNYNGAMCSSNSNSANSSASSKMSGSSKFSNGSSQSSASPCSGSSCSAGSSFSNSNSNGSQNSSATNTNIYCCLPSLSHSCMLVTSLQVCTQSQGIPGGSTLSACQQMCVTMSSSGNSSTGNSTSSQVHSNSSGTSNGPSSGGSSSAPCATPAVATTVTTSPKRPSFFASLLHFFSFFRQPAAQVVSGPPRMRITFTRVESTSPAHPAEPVIHLNSDTTVASGEWFDSGRLQSYTPLNGFSIFGDGGGRILARAAWFPIDGAYLTYYGTLEVEGEKVTYQNCNGDNSLWYCPEGMHDGIIAAPDNDEVWIDAGVLHFALHAKNVSNTDGSMDSFYIGYEPASSSSTSSIGSRISSATSSITTFLTSSAPTSATSLMPCSQSSSVSAHSFSNSSNHSNNSNSSHSANSSYSSIVVGGECQGNECVNGGNTFCALTNQTCVLTNTLPCLKCMSGNSSSHASNGSQASGFNSSQSSSVIVIADNSSSSVYTPFLECEGTECATIGDSFCALQNLSCIPQSTTPCFSCGAGNNLPPGSPCTENNQCASNICENGTCQPPLLPPGSPCTENNQCSSNLCLNGTCQGLPPNAPCSANDQCASFMCKNGTCQLPTPLGLPCSDNRECSTKLCKDGVCQNPLLNALAFLGETCTQNAQCITNLCVSNLCVPCSSGKDCSSNVCRNGACLMTNLMNGEICSDNTQCVSGSCLNGLCAATDVLPESVVQKPIVIMDPVTGKPLLSAPTDVLPATVIELPFSIAGSTAGTSDVGLSGQNVRTPGSYASAPQTPSTGPAALAVMLAGGAAGWLYRRRR